MAVKKPLNDNHVQHANFTSRRRTEGTAAQHARPLDFRETSNRRHKCFSSAYTIRTLDIHMLTSTAVLSSFITQLLRYVERSTVVSSFVSDLIHPRNGTFYIEGAKCIPNRSTTILVDAVHVLKFEEAHEVVCII